MGNDAKTNQIAAIKQPIVVISSSVLRSSGDRLSVVLFKWPDKTWTEVFFLSWNIIFFKKAINAEANTTHIYCTNTYEDTSKDT